jgi:hypothetical protein
MHGAGGEWHVDMSIFETLLDSAIHFASDHPLLAGEGFEARFDENREVAELIHAHYV